MQLMVLDAKGLEPLMSHGGKIHTKHVDGGKYVVGCIIATSSICVGDYIYDTRPTTDYGIVRVTHRSETLIYSASAVHPVRYCKKVFASTSSRCTPDAVIECLDHVLEAVNNGRMYILNFDSHVDGPEGRSAPLFIPHWWSRANRVRVVGITHTDSHMTTGTESKDSSLEILSDIGRILSSGGAIFSGTAVHDRITAYLKTVYG